MKNIIEYCSYKGLTPACNIALATPPDIEYCSYKGLTLLIQEI